MDIPQIIFEEGLDFESEDMYNQFLTYCEWFLYDGHVSIIEEIPDEVCLYYHDLCNNFIEPNLIQRMQTESK
jgi:hypothetical protein